MAKPKTLLEFQSKAENEFLEAVTKELKKQHGSRLDFKISSRHSRVHIISFKGVNRSDIEVKGYYSLFRDPNNPDQYVFDFTYNDAMHGSSDAEIRITPMKMSIERIVNHFNSYYG